VNRNVKSACNPIDFFTHRTRVGIDVDRCHPEAHYALPIEPATGVRGRLCARRPITHSVRRLGEPPPSFGPGESLQVETVPVVELDAFLFRQALLEGVAAMAGEGVGNLALGFTVAWRSQSGFEKAREKGPEMDSNCHSFVQIPLRLDFAASAT
jgi:hypothetical protein